MDNSDRIVAVLLPAAMLAAGIALFVARTGDAEPLTIAGLVLGPVAIGCLVVALLPGRSDRRRPAYLLAGGLAWMAWWGVVTIADAWGTDTVLVPIAFTAIGLCAAVAGARGMARAR